MIKATEVLYFIDWAKFTRKPVNKATFCGQRRAAPAIFVPRGSRAADGHISTTKWFFLLHMSVIIKQMIKFHDLNHCFCVIYR